MRTDHASDEQQTVGVKQLRAPRAAGVAGIAFSVVFVAALLLLRLALRRGFGLDESDSSASVANSDLAAAGLYLMPFAGIAFLWFIAAVRNQLGEREDKFFATVFFGSGLLFIAMLFAGAAAAGGVVAGAALGEGAEVSSAAVTFGRSFGYTLLFVYATKAAGVFAITTSTVIRALPGWPRWLSLLGFASGLVLLFSVTFWEAILLLFPLWVTVVSIYVLVAEHRRP